MMLWLHNDDNERTSIPKQKEVSYKWSVLSRSLFKWTIDLNLSRNDHFTSGLRPLWHVISLFLQFISVYTIQLCKKIKVISFYVVIATLWVDVMSNHQTSFMVFIYLLIYDLSSFISLHWLYVVILVVLYCCRYFKVSSSC